MRLSLGVLRGQDFREMPRFGLHLTRVMAVPRLQVSFLRLSEVQERRRTRCSHGANLSLLDRARDPYVMLPLPARDFQRQ